MGEWSCVHSLVTTARRRDVWDFWTDLRNHQRLERGVERVELDGPFATGTRGRTVTADYTQEWTLDDVVDGRRFAIVGLTPDGAGALRFAWELEDEGTGTRLTQRISAYGPRLEEHADELRVLEANAPNGMARLAAELDHLAGETGAA